MYTDWRMENLGDLEDSAATGMLPAVKALITLAEGVQGVIDGGELPQGFAMLAQDFVENVDALVGVNLVEASIVSFEPMDGSAGNEQAEADI